MFADSDSTNNTLVGFGAANIVLVDDIPLRGCIDNELMRDQLFKMTPLHPRFVVQLEVCQGSGQEI